MTSTYFFPQQPKKALCCWATMRAVAHESSDLNTAWRNDLPHHFFMGRQGALMTTLSPVSLKPPQKDNIPLDGRRWKAIEKNPRLKICKQLPLLSAGLCAKIVYMYFSRGLWSPSSELSGMSSKVCKPLFWWDSNYDPQLLVSWSKPNGALDLLRWTWQNV